MFGYIYKTTNKLNNKVYIGKKQSSIFIESYYGSGTIIKKAINKYGLNNFIVELICIAYSLDELNKMEKENIKYYKNKYKRDCYNIASGGQGGNLLLYAPESKRREAIEKMVSTRKDNLIGIGKNNPMYQSGTKGFHPLLGKNHSQETKNKISKSLKGNIPWNKNLKVVKTQKELQQEKVDSFIKNKQIIPIKVTNLINNNIKYFSTKKDCEDYYNIDIKYRLKKGKLKNEQLYFERISKEEYLKI